MSNIVNFADFFILHFQYGNIWFDRESGNLALLWTHGAFADVSLPDRLICDCLRSGAGLLFCCTEYDLITFIDIFITLNEMSYKCHSYKFYVDVKSNNESN